MHMQKYYSAPRYLATNAGGPSGEGYFFSIQSRSTVNLHTVHP